MSVLESFPGWDGAFDAISRHRDPDRGALETGGDLVDLVVRASGAVVEQRHFGGSSFGGERQGFVDRRMTLGPRDC